MRYFVILYREWGEIDWNLWRTYLWGNEGNALQEVEDLAEEHPGKEFRAANLVPVGDIAYKKKGELTWL